MKIISLLAFWAVLSCTNAAGGSNLGPSGTGWSSDEERLKRLLKAGYYANCDGRKYSWDDFENTRMGFQSLRKAEMLRTHPIASNFASYLKLYGQSKEDYPNGYLHLPIIKTVPTLPVFNNIDHALLNPYAPYQIVDIVMHKGPHSVRCDIKKEDETPLKFISRYLDS
ncbi:hypothetical protein K3495_g13298 [Podosphaera aphanis]|nr:hypothetical protein K3495_g13298 [Podosphaera aphanis]